MVGAVRMSAGRVNAVVMMVATQLGRSGVGLELAWGMEYRVLARARVRSVRVRAAPRPFGSSRGVAGLRG